MIPLRILIMGKVDFSINFLSVRIPVSFPFIPCPIRVWVQSLQMRQAFMEEFNGVLHWAEKNGGQL